MVGCLVSCFPLEQLRALDLSCSGVVGELIAVLSRASSLESLDISQCPFMTTRHMHHLSGGRCAITEGHELHLGNACMHLAISCSGLCKHGRTPEQPSQPHVPFMSLERINPQFSGYMF